VVAKEPQACTVSSGPQGAACSAAGLQVGVHESQRLLALLSTHNALENAKDELQLPNVPPVF